MDRKVDIAIIGAGSAGISAYKEVKKSNKSVLMIDHGPLGTTCARVGCMPSKAFIQVADFHFQRVFFKERGIHGADALSVNIPEVMQYVGKMRDYFAGGMVRYTKSLGEDFICDSAQFIEPCLLQVGEHKVHAKKVIIATGSTPNVPKAWDDFQHKILTSDNFFEQEDFAKNMAVIGAGVIGLELGQALSRLGIMINMFHADKMLAFISDPDINQVAIDIFKNEFPLYINEKAKLNNVDNHIQVETSTCKIDVEQILAAMGRKPNLTGLGLEKAGIEIPKGDIPAYQLGSMQLDDLPIYIAGDANNTRPLLHEAIDEGRIAGYNVTHKENHCFEHRTPLAIIFTQPNIALVGKAYKDLDLEKSAIGKIDYSDQGRARMMAANKGMLKLYADKQSGVLLGSEMIAPGGEHLAHLLSWAIQQRMTVHQALQMPFYHPVLEEGLRTALRDAAKQLEKPHAKNFELAMCESSAHGEMA